MNHILCLLLCLFGLSVKAGAPYLVNPGGVGTNISFDFRGSQTFRMFGPTGAGYFWAWGGAAFNTSSDRMVLAESNWPGIQLNFSHGLQLQNVSTVEMDFDAQTGNLTFQGTATGNGSGLTSLNGSQLTSGTVADARLSANVALLNRDPQTFSGNNNFQTVSGTTLAVSGIVGLNGPTTFTNAATMFSTLTAAGPITSTNGYLSVTNTVAANGTLAMGKDYDIVSGAATIGVGTFSNVDPDRYSVCTERIQATGTVTFTNDNSIHSSDFAISRTLTNGNWATVSIEILPRRATNMFFVQTK